MSALCAPTFPARPFADRRSSCKRNQVGTEPLHGRFKGIGQTPYLLDSSLTKGTLSDEGCDAIWRIIWQGSWTEVIDMDKNERHWFYGEPLHCYIERDIRLNAGEAKLEAFE